MRSRTDRQSCLLCFAEQDGATGQVNRLEIIGGAAGVSSQAPDRRLKVLIGGRVVVWRPKVKEVMPVNNVEQIDIPVDSEVGIQRKSKHPMVIPGSDFFTDVQEQGKRRIAWILKPDTAFPFPNKHPSRRIKGDAYSRTPTTSEGSGNDRFRKSGRHIGRQEFI